MTEVAQLEALVVLPATVSGYIYEILYWDTNVGNWVSYAPTVPLGSLIGVIGRYISTSDHTILLRLDFTFIRPDLTEEFHYGVGQAVDPNDTNWCGYSVQANQVGTWKVKLTLEAGV